MPKSPEVFIPTRRSLLTRLKHWDDQESWRDFFNTYWKLVYGVALKAGLSDAEAQEVVQETVISGVIGLYEMNDCLQSLQFWSLITIGLVGLSLMGLGIEVSLKPPPS